MATFNRIVIVFLVIVLLIGACILAAAPLATINQTNLLLGQLGAAMQTWQTENPTNFLIAQAAFGVSAVLLFGALLTLEFWVGRRRGVRIRTAEDWLGRLDITNVVAKLEWHLEQLAEIISGRARGQV